MARDHDESPTARGRSTDALIARLAADAHPVRRLPAPAARVGLWLALVLGVLLVAYLTIGARPDLVHQLGTASFAAPILLLLAAGVTSGALALLASVPGREPARGTVVGALALVLLALAATFASEPSPGFREAAGIGWLCAVRTVLVASLPWLVLMLDVGRGATLVPALAGLLAGAASLFLAAVVVRLGCPRDERWHLLLYHLAPVLLGAVASLALGRAFLARWRAR